MSGFKTVQFQKDQQSDVPSKPSVTWQGKIFWELGSVICKFHREDYGCIASDTPWLHPCTKISCDLRSYPEYISRVWILSKSQFAALITREEGAVTLLLCYPF